MSSEVKGDLTPFRSAWSKISRFFWTPSLRLVKLGQILHKYVSPIYNYLEEGEERSAWKGNNDERILIALQGARGVCAINDGKG